MKDFRSFGNLVSYSFFGDHIKILFFVAFTKPTNNGFGAISPYKVPKRAIPTVNIYSYVLGTLGRISNYRETGQPDRLAAAVNIGTNAFDIWNTGTALTNPIPVFHWTAEAEL